MTTLPLLGRMRARDPEEAGRVSTPLELLFDLFFVVAIASAADVLHHGIAGGHPGAIWGYLAAFFAIWWAWMNYSWFASAYAIDDVAYRLLTFVIMGGALTMAAGIPELAERGQSVTAVAGYAVMRLGMVGLWLRAAHADPARRGIAVHYAVGIALVQVFWLARLAVPESRLVWTFLAGVALELLVPVVAERREHTPFHPEHMAERYSLLTLIVLGEVVLSTVRSMQGWIVIVDAEGTGALALLATGAFLTVVSLWWIYFKTEHADLLSNPRTMFAFGYGHYLVFAAIAAVGAALGAAIDVVEHEAHGAPWVVGAFLTGACAVYLVVLMVLRSLSAGARSAGLPAGIAMAVLLVALGAAPIPMAWTVFGTGLVLAAGVAVGVLSRSVGHAGGEAAGGHG